MQIEQPKAIEDTMLKLLSSVQEIISHKNINNVVYNPGLVFPKHKSSLSTRLDINYWSYIKDPPANNSQQTTTELTNIIQLSNRRTKKEEQLVYLVDNDPIDLFVPFIKTYNISFPYQHFDELYVYIKEIIKDLKYYYNRPRPFQLAQFYNINLDTIITKTHQTPSYPSGHTAYCSLAACILSELYPQYSAKWWSLVDMCGLGRVLQGVHFPSDNIASISLVKRVYKSIVKLDETKFPYYGAKNGKI